MYSFRRPITLRLSLLLLVAALTVFIGCTGHTQTLWPDSECHPSIYKDPKKAFRLETQGGVVKVHFDDAANTDNYIQIDFGSYPLKDYMDGGYLETTVEITKPILRMDFVVANPAEPEHFWDSRSGVEGAAILQEGVHTYRYYLDYLPKKSAATGNHIYLFLQNLGGDARGTTDVKITSVTLHMPTPNWREEKRQAYQTQFRWPEVEPIEPLYYENFDHAVKWDQVASSPQLNRIPLDGKWRKKAFGERTWDYAFLADTSYAREDYDASTWPEVTVPEPLVPDQPGSHFWYRKEVNLSRDDLKGSVYLRFDDLCDDARLYVNGEWVGTQASVRKENDWVVLNGTRNRSGLPVKKAITWDWFDRCEIPFPFDKSAMPEDKGRLVLPIYFGEYRWPLAYEVGKFLHAGKNVVAVRLYGDPVSGWWIFRHRDDRAAKNIYGLLGSVALTTVPHPGVASFTRTAPTTVADDGTAMHRFDCTVADGTGVAAVRFRCEGQEKTISVDGGVKVYSAKFKLPAQFASYHGEVQLLDKAGLVTDSQRIDFHGVVVELRGTELRVNGDPYVIRGINGNEGVEFKNDRKVTKAEFIRVAKLYQELGFNTIRCNDANSWLANEAFSRGLMVMPVVAAATCNLSIGIFGQLSNPDFRLATDLQRRLPILMAETPNVLLWNDGNEIHHTPGYDDRPILQRYLTEAREAIRAGDPYHRPVTLANLDSWGDNWFFFEGQDIIGWNIYQKPPALTAQSPEVYAAAGGKPFVYTEWGTYKGKPDRDKDIDGWETEMRWKWNMISHAPGIGGFLYGWHGEMEDERGHAFLKDIQLPYTVKKDGGTVVFTNRSEYPMREVSFSLNPNAATVADNAPASGDGVAAGASATVPLDTVAVLAPGESREVKLPDGAKGAVEIRYDSHHGLKHFFSEAL